MNILKPNKKAKGLLMGVKVTFLHDKKEFREFSIMRSLFLCCALSKGFQHDMIYFKESQVKYYWDCNISPNQIFII